MALVEAVTKRKGGFSLTLSEQVYFIPREAWYEHETIVEGSELDEETYTRWLIPFQYSSGLAYSVMLLAQRARASGEIESKLHASGYMDEVIDLIIYKLKKEKLIDNRSFAVDWAAARQRKGIGSKRIRYELKNKGISDDDILFALDSLENEENDNILKELAAKMLRKYSSEESEYKRKAKASAALARKGYSFDEISRAIKQAEDEI